MSAHEDHVIGLNDWAAAFVQGVEALAYIEEVTRVYPDGRREVSEPRPIMKSTVATEESGETFQGMFGDTYPLMRYTFPDGRQFVERVQADRWASGPVFFLALQDVTASWVPESLWSEAVMKQHY